MGEVEGTVMQAVGIRGATGDRGAGIAEAQGRAPRGPQPARRCGSSGDLRSVAPGREPSPRQSPQRNINEIKDVRNTKHAPATT